MSIYNQNQLGAIIRANRLGLVAALGVMLASSAWAQRQITLPQNVRPDLFDSLVSSGASFDMDSPVEAQGVFDPPEVAAGGRVVYRLEVSALDESLTVPDALPTPAGMELHAGGRGQVYEMSPNMKLRPQTTVIFRGTVTNAGTFTMPSFTVMAYGKPITVPAATLTVLPSGSLAGHEGPRLVLDLPPGDLYVGQLLKVSLILPLAANNQLMGMTDPHITGDFIFAEPSMGGMRQETAQDNGRTYSAYVGEVMITPLKEGKQELVGQANTYVMRPDPNQPGAVRGMKMLIDSEPLAMDVKALPTDGVLPGFTGAVGKFVADVPSLSTREVRAGEPVTLTMMVRGDGNLGRLIPPTLPELHGWQGFAGPRDPSPSVSIQQRGFVVFKYTLIPLDSQLKMTPVIPFSYFDPQRKEYVALDFASVPIKVDAVPGMAALSAVAEPANTNLDEDAAAQEKEPVLGGLALNAGAPQNLIPLQQRRWFLSLQLLPAEILCALWAWERRRRYRELHPEVVLKERARRGLRRQLRAARRAAGAQDAVGFVTSAANAFREVCAPHSAANPEALVCADVLLELPESERQAATGQNIRRLFGAADALRFGGPMNDSSSLIALLPEMEKTLEEMEARL